MKKTETILTVDCGTQSSKAIVWDFKGVPIAEGRSTFKMMNPQFGWYEQNADEWWKSTCIAIKKVTRLVDVGQICAMGITHQRETFVPVSEDIKPLRNAFLHMDQRCQGQVEYVKKQIGAKKVHGITGKYPNYIPSVYDILWMKQEEPDISCQVHKYLDVSSFLIFHLVGRCKTSYVSADATSLINIQKKYWDLDLIKALDLSEKQLPEICSPGEIIGTVTKTASTETGLPEGLPVIAGAGDGVCAALGTRTIEKENEFLIIGTITALGGFSPEYLIDLSFRTVCSCIPGAYNLEANVAGGHIISWFMQNFDKGESSGSREEYWESIAEKIETGSLGLITVPYWMGSLGPYWDSAAYGITIGWTSTHTSGHFYRSILEGLAFEHRFLAECMTGALGNQFSNLVFVGGGAKSTLWGQIIADVFNIPVSITQTVEATSLGAAIITAYGIGHYRSIEEAVEGMTCVKVKYRPHEKNAAVYDKLYNKVYKKLYTKVENIMSDLKKIIN